MRGEDEGLAKARPFNVRESLFDWIWDVTAQLMIYFEEFCIQEKKCLSAVERLNAQIYGQLTITGSTEV